MEGSGADLTSFVEAGGLFAPILFISFHLLRPLFFLPVILCCITGGILFGSVAGSIYSIIGVMASSILFYVFMRYMPKTLFKVTKLKQKIFGKHASFTTSQITILRLIPFIHFHLLTLCIIESARGFKEYIKTSLLSNIPFVIIYTSVGKWMVNMSLFYATLFLILFLLLLFILRKKESNIKWNDFFQTSV